jgi:hypothetical protein
LHKQILIHEEKIRIEKLKICPNVGLIRHWDLVKLLPLKKVLKKLKGDLTDENVNVRI